MRNTAIIVPCYNEERRLQVAQFAASVTQHPWLHFIFINDGSTDGTFALIESLARQHARQMQAVNLTANAGKASAVWHGFKNAFAGGYENIGYWDADLSTPLSAIEQMCKQLAEPQITLVFGSRVRLLHRQIERKVLRHYLGRLFATIVSLILQLPIYDTQCGAKIFRNTPELRRVFSTPFSSRWIFDVEIFARFSLLHKEGASAPLSKTALEYPLQEWHEVPGSKLTLWDFFRACTELLAIASCLHWKKSFDPPA